MEALARRLTRLPQPTRSPYVDIVSRLSEQSVRKGTDAYRDIAWDGPDSEIDPQDPRWELTDNEPLGTTAWYRAQPQPLRARVGLHAIVAKMKLGIAFESVLMRGLLEFAATLPNGSPEYRYAHHEVAEEVQHSLMFQEFINRTGLAVPGLSGGIELLARRITRLGHAFPELFFIFVLGGEAPVDFEQRRALATREWPRLFERIMRVHVTEEARHVHFARHYLKERVVRLRPLRRAQVAWAAPVILNQMAGMMLRVPLYLAAEYDIPRSAFREAYRKNANHRGDLSDSVAPIREACVEAGLVTPLTRRWWNVLGVWARAERARAERARTERARTRTKQG